MHTSSILVTWPAQRSCTSSKMDSMLGRLVLLRKQIRLPKWIHPCCLYSILGIKWQDYFLWQWQKIASRGTQVEMPAGLNTQKLCKYFHLQPSYDYPLKNMSQNYFFVVVAAFNICLSGWSHIGSLSTNEERQRVGSWCNILFCHMCWSRSWCHLLGYNGSAYGCVLWLLNTDFYF